LKWKLLKVAEKSFRKLKGYWLLPYVLEGKKIVNGIAIQEKGNKDKRIPA